MSASLIAVGEVPRSTGGVTDSKYVPGGRPKILNSPASFVFTPLLSSVRIDGSGV